MSVQTIRRSSESRQKEIIDRNGVLKRATEHSPGQIGLVAPSASGTSTLLKCLGAVERRKIIPTFKRIYHIRDGKTYEETGEGRAFT